MVVAASARQGDEAYVGATGTARRAGTDDKREIFRRVLAADADRLAMDRSFPLDLPRLLDELGISLVRDRPHDRRGAHGYLRRQTRGWQIVVNETTAPARQRYTIAHELGHYLIEARFSFRPGTSREYWMLEDVCQAFAAVLLSPPATVEKALNPRPRQASGLFDVVDRLITATGLSLEGAARRVIEAIRVPTALAAIEMPTGPRDAKADPVNANLLWLHGDCAWTGRGRGQRIRPSHALRPMVERAVSVAIGDRVMVKLDGASSASVQRRKQSLVLVAAYVSD